MLSLRHNFALPSLGNFEVDQAIRVLRREGFDYVLDWDIEDEKYRILFTKPDFRETAVICFPVSKRDAERPIIFQMDLDQRTRQRSDLLQFLQEHKLHKPFYQDDYYHYNCAP